MQVARVAPDWPVPSLMHRRRVLGDRITYVGLDVHKDGIVVAVAEGGLRGEVRDYGRIANTPAALQRLARKLGQDGLRLRFCYEAGPCGYGIQRQLSALGHECIVVAPSLIPKRAGCQCRLNFLHLCRSKIPQVRRSAIGRRARTKCGGRRPTIWCCNWANGGSIRSSSAGCWRTYALSRTCVSFSNGVSRWLSSRTRPPDLAIRSGATV